MLSFFHLINFDTPIVYALYWGQENSHVSVHATYGKSEELEIALGKMKLKAKGLDSFSCTWCVLQSNDFRFLPMLQKKLWKKYDFAGYNYTNQG